MEVKQQLSPSKHFIDNMTPLLIWSLTKVCLDAWKRSVRKWRMILSCKKLIIHQTSLHSTLSQQGLIWNLPGWYLLLHCTGPQHVSILERWSCYNDAIFRTMPMSTANTRPDYIVGDSTVQTTSLINFHLSFKLASNKKAYILRMCCACYTLGLKPYGSAALDPLFLQLQVVFYPLGCRIALYCKGMNYIHRIWVRHDKSLEMNLDMRHFTSGSIIYPIKYFDLLLHLESRSHKVY